MPIRFAAIAAATGLILSLSEQTPPPVQVVIVARVQVKPRTPGRVQGSGKAMLRSAQERERQLPLHLPQQHRRPVRVHDRVDGGSIYTKGMPEADDARLTARRHQYSDVAGEHSIPLRSGEGSLRGKPMKNPTRSPG